jgi:uracil-DNA glycosylase
VTATVTTRPFLLGEAPSRSGDRYWRFPLSGAVGQRLAEWAGLEPQAGGTRYGRWYWPLNDAFELRNLLARYPGSLGAGMGAALPTAPARQAWELLRPEMAGRVVVLLGARLAILTGLAPLKGEGGALRTGFYEWQEPEWCAAALVLPHPSALNRKYNDPEEQRQASLGLREALARTTGD